MSEEQSEIQKLKEAHDYCVTVVELLTNRFNFYHGEFEGVNNMVKFFKQMALDLRKKIEDLEPKGEQNGEENGAAEGTPV